LRFAGRKLQNIMVLKNFGRWLKKLNRNFNGGPDGKEGIRSLMLDFWD
jgi:hypothetical protein